jgi:hypothetical protein
MDDKDKTPTTETRYGLAGPAHGTGRDHLDGDLPKVKAESPMAFDPIGRAHICLEILKNTKDLPTPEGGELVRAATKFLKIYLACE